MWVFEDGLKQAAHDLAKALPWGVCIYLRGDLGTGKTTFSQAFIKALGEEGPVKSPTYSIVESYALPGGMVHHFDCYRLGEPEELAFMGIDDYVRQGGTLLIEWPDKGEGFLPSPDVTVSLRYAGEEEVLLSSSTGRFIVVERHY